jgi:hypothetical protein
MIIKQSPPIMGSYISVSRICRFGPRSFKKFPVQSVRGEEGKRQVPILLFLQRKEIPISKSKLVAK